MNRAVMLTGYKVCVYIYIYIYVYMYIFTKSA